MAITFDKENELIIITAPQTEVTIQNLINAIRDWEDELANMGIPSLATASGKEDLGGGVFVGITVKLIVWKIQFEPRLGPDYILCNITGGNLVAVDANGDSMSPIEPAAYVTVSLTSSSSATLQELTAIQHSSFNNGVTIDVVDGVSGTTFPTGTGEQPVNNLADAKTIAQSRGFRILYIIGDLILTATDNVDDYALHGESEHTSTITIQSGCSTLNAEFHDTAVQGTLNGEAHVTNCKLGGGGGLFNFEGNAHECILFGDIALAGSGLVQFLNCWSGVPGNLTPEIDMNGDGPSLGMRAYAGGVLLKNKTGTSSVSLDFISGQAIITSTVTNGTIVIRGTAKVTDNSGGAADVDITNVVNPYRVSDAMWDESETDHVAAGTFGKLLNDIEEIEAGRWLLDADNNQMIFYKDDGVTPLLVFKTFDETGQPTGDPSRIYERRPLQPASQTIFVKLIVRQTGTEDLLAEFEAQAIKNLFAKLEVGQGAQSLFAKLTVAQDIKNLFAKFTVQ